VGGSGEQSGKLIYININGAFVKSNNYKIMINEINDISKQYSITEKEYTFNGSYPEKTNLKIQSAASLNKNTISVTFDRPLDPTLALTKELYTVTGISQQGFAAIPAKVMFDADDNSSKVNIYLPAGKELTSNNTYKVTVLSVMKDNLGNVAGTNMEYTFYGNGASDAKPVISDAVIISKDTIKITSNENIV
jgi:hypothetical protein